MGVKSGTHLGPYEVLSTLGAGGMGEVYRARDTKLGRDVAVKVLPDSFATDPDRRGRFQREAQLLASLNHPHIAAIYGFEDSGSVHALVLELVEGETLADRIARGPVAVDEALRIATQLADALNAAHDHGIVHRDLKPANIKITPAGVVKVLDFGLAKLADPAGHDRPAPSSSLSPTVTSPALITGMDALLGTAAYMSPEQAKRLPVDKRADIWAFGVVLYEMLTGRRGFDGDTTVETLSNVLTANPEWSALPPETPSGVRSLLRRCLQKDPTRRLRDIGDARFQIEEALNQPVGTATVEAPGRVRPPRERLWWGVAALVGFVTASAIGAVLWATWPRPPAELRRLSFQVAPPPGAEFQFSANGGGSAISPDGQRLAFMAVTNGTPRLWIRDLDSLTARELPDTDGAKLPFWSADSSAVGFFTSSDLRRIDVSGVATFFVAGALDSRGGTWNGDGTIVFSPNAVGPLYQVSASGGTPTPLTALSVGESSHRWPKFLPDGRTLLYFVQGTKPGVYLTTLDRPGETKRLFGAVSNATYVPGQNSTSGYLLWVARNAVMAQPFDSASAQLMGSAVSVPGTEDVASSVATNFASLSASNDGTLLYNAGGSRYQLGWFGRDGVPRGTVGGIDQYIGLRLSPDGHEVLVTIRDAAANGDLWRVDLASGSPSRVTSEGGGWYAVWSPDNQQVVFTAVNRREVLQTVNIRGGGEVQTLMKFGVQVYPSDWSPDGKYLAYTANTSDTSDDVWLFAMTGTRKSEALLQSRFSERHAQFSPDGRWVAFTSNETGRDDVYVQSFPDPATRRMVSSGGGAYPRWGSEGRELLYRASDGQLVTRPLRFVGSTVEPGTASVVMRLVEAVGVHPYPYDVAADGRILALTPPSSGVYDLTLTVLTNWEAALTRSAKP